MIARLLCDMPARSLLMRGSVKRLLSRRVYEHGDDAVLIHRLGSNGAQ